MTTAAEILGDFSYNTPSKITGDVMVTTRKFVTKGETPLNKHCKPLCDKQQWQPKRREFPIMSRMKIVECDTYHQLPHPWK